MVKWQRIHAVHVRIFSQGNIVFRLLFAYSINICIIYRDFLILLGERESVASFLNTQFI